MQASNKGRHYYAMLTNRHSNQRSLPSSRASCCSHSSGSIRIQSCCLQDLYNSSHNNSKEARTHLHKSPIGHLVPNISSLATCPPCRMGPCLQQFHLQHNQQCIIRRHTQQHLMHISLGCIQGWAWISATQLTHSGPAIPTLTTAIPLSLQALGAGRQCRQAGVCKAQQAVLQGLGETHQSCRQFNSHQQKHRTGFSP